MDGRWWARLRARLERVLRSWRAARQRRLTLGCRGERYAARYLARLGYKIVARGERLRGGELDLVAVDGRTLVFVEVKTRRRDPDDGLVELVTRAKQQRLARAAAMFLKRHRLLEYGSRFDIITIVWPTGGSPQLRHYRAAFDAVQPGESMY